MASFILSVTVTSLADVGEMQSSKRYGAGKLLF
jgi:hypothetical protein